MSPSVSFTQVRSRGLSSAKCHVVFCFYYLNSTHSLGVQIWEKSPVSYAKPLPSVSFSRVSYKTKTRLLINFNNHLLVPISTKQFDMYNQILTLRSPDFNCLDPLIYTRFGRADDVTERAPQLLRLS